MRLRLMLCKPVLCAILAAYFVVHSLLELSQCRRDIGEQQQMYSDIARNYEVSLANASLEKSPLHAAAGPPMKSVVIERQQWKNLQPSHVKVIGRFRQQKNFLTIGIPCVQRVNGAEYLVNTLTSLIENTSWQDKGDIVVVVFLADTDQTKRNSISTTIEQTFYEYIELGFLQIIEVNQTFYPDFEELQHNFGDSPERIVWRSKQAVDFALMFLYAKNLSMYYMQLEDDVISAERFLDGIRSYIKEQTRRWVVLEFSELGFIGKLFHSEDLVKLARFMLMFYDQQPVDWLLRHFRNTMAQSYLKLRRPTLFQHIGVNSSLSQKSDNFFIDKYFEAGEKPPDIDNPPATIVTNIAHYNDYVPDLAYSSGSGYFWATQAKIGDTVTVVFNTNHRLHRVRVMTGNKAKPRDILRHGVLWASDSVTRYERERNVVHYGEKYHLGNFSYGQVDVNNLESVLSVPMRCIVIEVTESQSQWIVFFHIGVQKSTVV